MTAIACKRWSSNTPNKRFERTAPHTLKLSQQECAAILQSMRSLLLVAAASASMVMAQRNPSWSRPVEPHTITGNLHYVGTEDLACFLISTSEGHILINTGLQDSAPMIRAGIHKLGFKLEDVRILLTMQAHDDHVGAMAEVQKWTGAQVFATEGDSASLADGGISDPHWGDRARFSPVKVSRRLTDGEVIRLGDSQLEVILTPGHSRGSVSYQLQGTHEGKPVTVSIVNMPSVVMPLRNPKYPGIVDDFERSFRRLKRLKPEIWVAAHASQYGMQRKLKAGSFVDPEGYGKAVAEYETNFRAECRKQGIEQQ